MVDQAGHWLYKVAGFSLQALALLILWHALTAPPMAWQHSLITAFIAVLLSVLGLWLVVLAERLRRRDQP